MTYKKETLKKANCTYIKKINDSTHLIKDNNTNKIEVWASSKDYAGYALIYKNTHLEFCGEYKL